MCVADIVIVAKSCTPALREITQRALDTLRESEPLLDMHQILVETWPDAAPYAGVTTVRPPADCPLNYNRYLNLGLVAGTSPFIACCNNDLVFEPGWLTSNLAAFAAQVEIQCLSSKSPLEYGNQPYKPHTRFTRGLHPGRRVMTHLSGWCYTIRRSLLDKIGPFDETVAFWYSDCLFAAQLERYGIMNYLNAESHVQHLHRQSHGTLSGPVRRKVTAGSKKAYMARKLEILAGG